MTQVFFKQRSTLVALAAAAFMAACGGGGGSSTTETGGSTGTCTAAPCINFAESTVSLTDFGGLASEVVNDPANSSNKVLKMTKEAADETWAGVTVLSGIGSAGANVLKAARQMFDIAAVSTEVIDPSKGITLRVYSAAVGVPVMVKIENADNGDISALSTVNSTVANQWETMTFTYPNASTSATYNKVSVFPAYDQKVDAVVHVDELKYSTKTITPVDPTSGLTIVNFDEATPAILDAFEGTSFEAVVEGTNKVAKLNKPTTAQAWGGATFKSCPANTVGQTPSIPFTSTLQTISVKVKAPRVGVVFSLEARGEGTNAATEVFAEATNTTTEWETLTFNFANKTYGAAIDPSKAYNKLSIFPNFSKANEGSAARETADRVYLIDDMKLVGSTATLGTCPAVPVTGVPTTAASVPTATNVVTLFSDANGYSAVTNGTFRTDWSSATFTAETVASDNVLKYATLDYVGIEPSAPIDISSATYVNLDVWTADLTKIRVKLVNFLNGTWNLDTNKEHEVTLELSAQQRNTWHRIRIPMSEFTGLTQRTHVKQFILSVGDGVKGTVYVDNIFFSSN